MAAFILSHSGMVYSGRQTHNTAGANCFVRTNPLSFQTTVTHVSVTAATVIGGPPLRRRTT